MKKEKNTLGVALVKRACFLCGKIEDAEIVMNTVLVESLAKKVEDMHGQVVGYLDKPCEECRGMMSKGFLLIGVIEAKTEDRRNPYRSGNQWVITRDAAMKMFKHEDLKKGAAFIDVDVARNIGLTTPENHEEKG